MFNQALMLSDRNALDWADVPVAPRPGPGEVRIAIRAFALNHLDLFSLRGMAFAKRALPLVAGVEGAGYVTDVGPDVAGLSLGDAVVIYPGVTCGRCIACREGRDNLCEAPEGIMGFHRHGIAAHTVTVPARLAIKVPDGVDIREATTAPVTFATVLHMLVTNARLSANESLLVHAAGSGIGSTAIKLAKRMGVSVFATVGDDKKIPRARSIGADYVINYREQRFESVIRRLTDKRGVDVVFEHVGVSTWRGSMASLALGGRLVTCGSTSGVSTELDLLHLFNRQIKILASFGGTIADVSAGLALMADGLRPEIDAIVPPARIHEALARIAARNVFGKIIVDMEMPG